MIYSFPHIPLAWTNLRQNDGVRHRTTHREMFKYLNLSQCVIDTQGEVKIRTVTLISVSVYRRINCLLLERDSWKRFYR